MENSDFRTTATRGFAWNYAYKITEFGLINLYTIAVVRHFGPNISALYSLFLATGTIMCLVAGFAVDGAILRFIGRVVTHNKSDNERFDSFETLTLPNYLNMLLAFRLLIAAAVSIVYITIIMTIPAVFPSMLSSLIDIRSFTPYLIIFLFAQSLVSFSTVALTGLFESKRVFIASAISRVVLITAGFALVIGNSITIERAIIVFVASTSISAIFLFIGLRREVHKRQGIVTHTKRLSLRSTGALLWAFARSPKQIWIFLLTPPLLYGITTWGNDILSLLLGKQTDILMMGAMLGERSAQIGYYQAASLILLFTEYIFFFGFSGTLVSIFSSLVDSNQKNNNSTYSGLIEARKEIAGFQNAVLVPLLFFVLCFTDRIVHLLFGADFHPSVLMIRVGLLALLTSVAFFGGGMQVTSLVSIGKERVVFRNRLVWGGLNMGVNIVLIYYYGGIGALVGTQYCNLGAVISESYFGTKFIGSSANYKATVRIIFIAVLASAIPAIIFHFVGDMSDISTLALAATTEILIVFGLYRLFNVPELESIIKRLRHIIS